MLSNIINNFRKIGLQDATINLSKVPSNIDCDLLIKELFIFNKGSLLSNVRFKQQENSLNANKLHKCLLSAIPCSKNDDNFIFRKIYFANSKVYFFYDQKTKLILCGIFNEFASGYLIKIYLLHLYIAFINFNNSSTIDSIIKDDNYSRVSLDKIHNIHNNAQNENYSIKIFEMYFVVPLTYHFEKIIKNLIKKEEMYLLNIKYKNFYIVDIDSGDVLFDMLSVRVKYYFYIFRDQRKTENITIMKNFGLS